MLTVIGWKETFENNRTRELANLKWVPVPNKMDGEGYTTLVEHPNGGAHLGAWLAILEIASRQEVRGVIEGGKSGIPHRLARISRLPAGLFDEVLPRLVEIGWIQLDTEMSQVSAVKPHDSAVSSIPFSSLLFSSENKNEELVSKKSDAHGSRLHMTEPTAEMTDYACGDLGWPVDRVSAVWVDFCDYWKAIPGAKGRKVDWLGTWRRWCRTENEKRSPVRRQMSVQQRNEMAFEAFRREEA